MVTWYAAFHGPFYWYRSTVIPAWIDDYIHYNVLGVITNPLQNLCGEAVEV